MRASSAESNAPGGYWHGFTGKEFLSSDLYDFGTRMYHSSSGRFLSPDEPFADQHPEDPQSWNLYAHVRNNPLRFIDPTGNYVCGSSMSQQQCQDFEAARQAAQSSANALKDRYGTGSKQYKAAQAAIDSYGAAGVTNGVTSGVGTSAKGTATVALNAPGQKTADNPSGQNIVATFDPLAVGASGVVAHEGVHVADASAWTRSGFDLAKQPMLYQSEFNSFNVQASLLEGDYLNAASRGEASGFMYRPFSMGGRRYLLWFPGWPASNVSNAINALLAVPPASGGIYGLTPRSTTRMFRRPVR